jgi:hypothetical protein
MKGFGCWFLAIGGAPMNKASPTPSTFYNNPDCQTLVKGFSPYLPYKRQGTAF